MIWLINKYMEQLGGNEWNHRVLFLVETSLAPFVPAQDPGVNFTF